MTVFRGILMTWPGRIFAVALVGIMAGGAVFVSRANAPAAKTELRTQAVTKGSVIQSVAVSGSVAAMNQTKMTFKSTGKISNIYVSVGQQVTAGQPLAKLDTTDLEAALAQAQSNFGSFTDNATGGISSFQDSLGTIQSQIDALIAEMSRIVGGGDTGDLRNAMNAVSGANSPAMQNARANSVTLLSPALADYQSARSALLSVVADFDSATAAGNDTTNIATSFQLAMTNYSIATSRLSTALDTTSAVLGTVQTAVTTAQASLNTQSTKTLHEPFDQWRADLATLYTLVGAQQQNVATTAQRGQQSIDAAQTSLNSKPYDLTNSQASVDNAASAVQTAQTNVDNAVVTAPSAGVVASIASQVGE